MDELAAIESNLKELRLEKKLVENRINVTLPYWSEQRLRSVGNWVIWIIYYIIIFSYFAVPEIIKDPTLGHVLLQILGTLYIGVWPGLFVTMIVLSIFGDFTRNFLIDQIGCKYPVTDHSLNAELKSLNRSIDELEKRQHRLSIPTQINPYSSQPIPDIVTKVSQASTSIIPASINRISTATADKGSTTRTSGFQKLKDKAISIAGSYSRGTTAVTKEKAPANKPDSPADKTTSMKQPVSQTSSVNHFKQFSNTVPPVVKTDIPSPDVNSTSVNVISNLSEHFGTSNFSVKSFKSSENKIQEDYKPGRIINYDARHSYQTEIGLSGELFVMEFEQHRLIAAGRKDLADRVQHISKEEGNVIGFDIKSFETDGSEKHIEVKTTAEGKNAAFFLTSNEWTRSKSLSTYCIYRLFNFELQKGTGSIYIISSEDLSKYFTIEPYSYKITPHKLK